MDEVGLTDSSSNSYTTTINGNAARSAAQSKFGGYSAVLDGNGDYITVPDNDDWHFGSGDFTIDFWVRFSDVSSGYHRLVGHWEAGNPQRSFALTYSADTDTLRFSYSTDGSSSSTKAESWNPSVNTWYHVAVVRDGDDLHSFIDGNEIGTSTDVSGVSLYNATVSLSVGTIFSFGSPDVGCLYGYMDELRISKGIARWTSNFDVPTEAYFKCDISGTLSDDARVIVMKEIDWSIESNTTETAGSYSITTTSGTKLVIAKKSDGEVLVFGDVTPSS